MPNEIHEVSMHAQNFQEPIPNENEMPSEKGYQIDKSSLGRYQLKDTSRNEISIDTH